MVQSIHPSLDHHHPMTRRFLLIPLVVKPKRCPMRLELLRSSICDNAATRKRLPSDSDRACHLSSHSRSGDKREKCAVARPAEGYKR